MAPEEQVALEPTSKPGEPPVAGGPSHGESPAWHQALEGELVAGRWRALRLLGVGGMGVVYAGVEERSGQEVALKILHPRMASRERTVRRFAREAQILAALSHPNIVRVIEYVYDWRLPVLVMELVSGRPLDAVVKASGRLAPERAAAVALQVLAALEAAHRAHVVHRDLKPSNVLLGEPPGSVEPLVKVLDFGLALMLEGEHDTRLTAAGAMLGTPSTMAPEQVLGGEVDERTDLYALGCVLFNALTGRHLHLARSFGELLEIFSSRQQPSANDLAGVAPEPLAAVVVRALAAAPGDRFQSARQMAEALEAALGAPRPAGVDAFAMTLDSTRTAPSAFVRPTVAVEAVPPTVALPGPAAGAPPVPSFPLAPPRAAPPQRSRGRLALVAGLVALAPVVAVLAFAGWAVVSRTSPPRPAATSGPTSPPVAPAPVPVHPPSPPIPDPVPVRSPAGPLASVFALDQPMGAYLIDSGRRVDQTRSALTQIVGRDIELDGTLAAGATRWIFEYLDRDSGATRVHTYTTHSSFVLYSFELRPATGGSAQPPLLGGSGVVPDSDAVMQLFAGAPGCVRPDLQGVQPLSLIYRSHEADPARAVIEVEPTTFRLVIASDGTFVVERGCDGVP